MDTALLDTLKTNNCPASAQFPSLPAAVVHYEHHMRQRAATVAHDMLEQTAALHAAGGLAHLVGLFGGGRPEEEAT